MTLSNYVKGRVDALISERGLRQKDVEVGIRMSHGGYIGMWKRGSVDLATLQALAHYFKLPVAHFLPPSEQLTVPGVSDPAVPYVRRRFLEQRVEDLELAVSELKGKKR